MYTEFVMGNFAMNARIIEKNDVNLFKKKAHTHTQATRDCEVQSINNGGHDTNSMRNVRSKYVIVEFDFECNKLKW